MLNTPIKLPVIYKREHLSKNIFPWIHTQAYLAAKVFFISNQKVKKTPVNTLISINYSALQKVNAPLVIANFGLCSITHNPVWANFFMAFGFLRVSGDKKTPPAEMRKAVNIMICYIVRDGCATVQVGMWNHSLRFFRRRRIPAADGASPVVYTCTILLEVLEKPGKDK